MKRPINKIVRALEDAISGRVARRTRYIITDLKTARRMERNGHSYTWEMYGNRPTGRCIVKMKNSPRVMA